MNVQEALLHSAEEIIPTTQQDSRLIKESSSYETKRSLVQMKWFVDAPLPKDWASADRSHLYSSQCRLQRIELSQTSRTISQTEIATATGNTLRKPYSSTNRKYKRG